MHAAPARVRRTILTNRFDTLGLSQVGDNDHELPLAGDFPGGHFWADGAQRHRAVLAQREALKHHMLEPSSGQDCDMHPVPRLSLGTKVSLYDKPVARGCLGGLLPGAAASHTTDADPQNTKQDSHSSFDNASLASGSADRKHGSIPRFCHGTHGRLAQQCRKTQSAQSLVRAVG